MTGRSTPISLRINLQASPITAALRDGRVKSDFVHFDFCGPKVAHQGFAPMVRENAFDAGELALATFLQARCHDKPFSMLPAVMSGGFHHSSISYNADFGILAPKDIEGRRVGVRSYTQTTGVWVRGFLSRTYGVDVNRVTWVCNLGAHLTEYPDPANVQRVESDRDQGRMLVDGEIAALITGVASLPRHASIRPLIPDPQAAAQAWSAAHGGVPINHVFVINSELARARPDVVREVYRMLLESRNLAGMSNGLDAFGFGADAVRDVINVFCGMALEQRIVKRTFDADELLTDTADAIQGLGNS